MPTRDSDDGQIQFRQLGGLNEKPAPNALEAPDFAVVHALYQRNTGALQRLEGTKALALLPAGVGVLGGNQLDDGTGDIIVQGDNGTEYRFTLDELFQRTPVSSLTYSALQDDENMPTAIVVQTAANSTDVANIGGASANTWYQRPLTANSLNESSIVVTFASNQFELAPGTYRFRGWVTAAFFLDCDGGAVANAAEAGFQAVISDTTATATAAIGSSESVKFERTASSGGFNFGPVNVKSFIDETYTFATINHVFEIRNAFTQTLTGNGTVTATGGAASNITTAINGAAPTEQYVRLVISKIA